MTDERPSATLSTRGRVTIPRAIRERMALRPGDRLQFELRADGALEARVATLAAGMAANNDLHSRPSSARLLFKCWSMSSVLPPFRF